MPGTSAANSFVEMFAGGGISFGNLIAGDYVDVQAGGAIQFVSATSDEDIDFASGSTVTGGAVTSGDSVTVEANGNIALGALSAGIVNPSSAIDAGYSVGLATNGSISTGAVNAAADIGLGAAGTIATGNLNAGGTVLALGGGNMSFGGITTGALGQLYIADFSMIALGGTLDNFDPLPILAADPVASAGSITIGGPVSTGWMRAAGAGITAGDITAATFIDLLSTGGMTLGNLVAGQNIELTSGGSVTLGNATAGEIIDFDGIGGNLTGGNMTAGDWSRAMPRVRSSSALFRRAWSIQAPRRRGTFGWAGIKRIDHRRLSQCVAEHRPCRRWNAGHRQPQCGRICARSCRRQYDARFDHHGCAGPSLSRRFLDARAGRAARQLRPRSDLRRQSGRDQRLDRHRRAGFDRLVPGGGGNQSFGRGNHRPDDRGQRRRHRDGWRPVVGAFGDC